MKISQFFVDFLENMNFKIPRSQKSPKPVSRLSKMGPVKVLNDAKMSSSKFLDNIEDALGCLVYIKNMPKICKILLLGELIKV